MKVIEQLRRAGYTCLALQLSKRLQSGDLSRQQVHQVAGRVLESMR